MKFSEIIGQHEVKTRLTGARTEGRIAHALLFLGPEGNGNLALAIAYAQYLLCTNPEPEDSCGVCDNCRKVNSYQYADLFFSFPFFKKSGREVNIADDYSGEWRNCLLQGPYFGIDHWMNELSSDSKQLDFTVHEAGSIIRKVNLKGYEGRLKIMIIWMCDYMKAQTANKLLKVLEEPPDNTLFFLTAHSADNILPTILSRTQVIRVPRIADEDLTSALLKKDVDPERAASIAHYSDGNWWKALQLVDALDTRLELSAVFIEWMRLCFSRKMLGLFAWINSMDKQQDREGQKQFLSYALEQIRQNLVYNYAGVGLTRMNEAESAFAKKFAPFINDLNAEEMMQELNKAHFDIGRNVNGRIVFSHLSFRIHRLLNRKP